MGAGPHRSGYNRRRKSQTIKLLPKKNSALLLLSSRSEKKEETFPFLLSLFFLKWMWDSMMRDKSKGGPPPNISITSRHPPACVGEWPSGRRNVWTQKSWRLVFFRGKKRRRFSSMCDVRCFKPIVRFSCHLTLFFSSSSHHSPPFCRLADWIPVMDGSWRASASHAPFQLRRLPLTVTGHSTYPCAQLTFFLSLYLSLPYFFFPFRRNGSERERRRRKNLWAISSSRPLERVIRLSLIFGYFFFFLTSPRSLNTARRHSRYFSLSLSSIYLYDYASIQSRSAKTRECASGIRENPDFSRSLDLIVLLFSYLPVCPLIRHTRPWMGIQRNAS